MKYDTGLSNSALVEQNIVMSNTKETVVENHELPKNIVEPAYVLPTETSDQNLRRVETYQVHMGLPEDYEQPRLGRRESTATCHV